MAKYLFVFAMMFSKELSLSNFTEIFLQRSRFSPFFNLHIYFRRASLLKRKLNFIIKHSKINNQSFIAPHRVELFFEKWRILFGTREQVQVTTKTRSMCSGKVYSEIQISGG